MKNYTVDDEMLDTTAILQKAFPENEGLKKIFIIQKELDILNYISMRLTPGMEYYCIPFQNPDLDKIIIEGFSFPKRQFYSETDIEVDASDIRDAYESVGNQKILGWTHNHPGNLGAFHSPTDKKNCNLILNGLEEFNTFTAYRNIPLYRWITSPNNERNNFVYPNLMIKSKLTNPNSDKNIDDFIQCQLDANLFLERYKIITYAISIVVAASQTCSGDEPYPFIRVMLNESSLQKDGTISVPKRLKDIKPKLVYVDTHEEFDPEYAKALIDSIEFIPSSELHSSRRSKTKNMSNVRSHQNDLGEKKISLPGSEQCFASEGCTPAKEDELPKAKQESKDNTDETQKIAQKTIKTPDAIDAIIKESNSIKLIQAAKSSKNKPDQNQDEAGINNHGADKATSAYAEPAAAAKDAENATKDTKNINTAKYAPNKLPADQQKQINNNSRPLHNLEDRAAVTKTRDNEVHKASKKRCLEDIAKKKAELDRADRAEQMRKKEEYSTPDARVGREYLFLHDDEDSKKNGVDFTLDYFCLGLLSKKEFHRTGFMKLKTYLLPGRIVDHLKKISPNFNYYYCYKGDEEINDKIQVNDFITALSDTINKYLQNTKDEELLKYIRSIAKEYLDKNNLEYRR